jgi:hypothetical protein
LNERAPADVGDIEFPNIVPAKLQGWFVKK